MSGLSRVARRSWAIGLCLVLLSAFTRHQKRSRIVVRDPTGAYEIVLGSLDGATTAGRRGVVFLGADGSFGMQVRGDAGAAAKGGTAARADMDRTVLGCVFDAGKTRLGLVSHADGPISDGLYLQNGSGKDPLVVLGRHEEECVAKCGGDQALVRLEVSPQRAETAVTLRAGAVSTEMISTGRPRALSGMVTYDGIEPRVGLVGGPGMGSHVTLFGIGGTANPLVGIECWPEWHGFVLYDQKGDHCDALIGEIDRVLQFGVRDRKNGAWKRFLKR